MKRSDLAGAKVHKSFQDAIGHVSRELEAKHHATHKKLLKAMRKEAEKHGKRRR